MSKYRKKPVEIEAFVFNPDCIIFADWENGYKPVRATSYLEIHDLIGTNGCSKSEPYYNWDRLGIVDTLEGRMIAEPGDYIIKGVKGEFYPCKPDIFEMTYDYID